MRQFVLALLMTSALFLSAQESADSVSASINLEEFVVVGERAWIEGNKAVFIPTKSEKNLSNSPASLVKRMHIPTVIVNEDAITTVYGQGVAIYINGIEASNIDLTTFWPKQTTRVEYIDHPSDPKYKGAPAVLNFVMTEYEVGGVTKVEGVQKIPNLGDYNVSSKLVYKKMTYGVTLGGGYSRNHSSSYTGSQDYKHIYYEGDKYDLISHRFTGNSYNRSENLLAAINARYRSKGMVIIHSIGVNYQHNPGSGSNNADDWQPVLFNSHTSSTYKKSHSLSPQASGGYYFSLSDRWHLNCDWSYAFSHVNNYSLYNADNLEAIMNSAKGNTHSATLSIVSSYLLKPNKMALWLKINSSMDRYETEYSGSSEARNLQWRGNTNFSAALQWAVFSNAFLSFEPGLAVNYWHLFGGKKYDDVRPQANAHFNWGINRHWSLTAYLGYIRRAPSASETGNVILRQDELTWLASNPALKGMSVWLPSINLVWLQSEKFRSSLNFNYSRHENELIEIYTPADASRGGIIKTYANSKPSETYGINLLLNSDLLDNKLSVNLQPEYVFFKSRGEYADSFGRFRLRGGASYTMGNFEVALTYLGAEKSMHNGGMNKNWHGDEWKISGKYGNGNVYVYLCVNNIFNTHAKSWTKLNSQNFVQQYDYLNIGRSVYVSVSYTFGYGKKVDRSIDISNPNAAKSAVLDLD